MSNIYDWKPLRNRNIYIHLCVYVSLLAYNVMKTTNTDSDSNTNAGCPCTDSDSNTNAGCQCTKFVTKNKTVRLTFVFTKWQACH